MNNLNVVLNELKEGRNLVIIKDIKMSEKVDNLFSIRLISSNGVEEVVGIFNDISRKNGLIRAFIKATIYEEGQKEYNLEQAIGKETIINLEKATSKDGNEYWKVKAFEKVTEDTDRNEFEFIDDYINNFNAHKVIGPKFEEIDDISQLADL